MDENNQLCIECAKQSFCDSLCPEAEVYVSQDYAFAGELPLKKEFIGERVKKTNWLHLKQKNVKLSEADSLLVAYNLQGLKEKAILEKTGLSRYQYYAAMRNIRKLLGVDDV